MAAIQGKSPVGLSHTLKDQWGTPCELPDAEVAAVLQQTAWDAVQAYAKRQAENSEPDNRD